MNWCSNCRSSLRTSTVMALCKSMLASRDFAAMPILADALEDAGCRDEELLKVCREPTKKKESDDDKLRCKYEAERVVNLIYSDETAAAVRWMEKWGHQIDSYDDTHDYASCIHAGHQGVKGAGYCWGTDEGADYFRDGESNCREWWENWAIITGQRVPEELQVDRGWSRCAC